ncbi:hypothetical protein yaldo0001_40920, partial [Yersinia aldovae ATCC 35236]
MTYPAYRTPQSMWDKVYWYQATWRFSCGLQETNTSEKPA